ncbi:MAG: class II aldolase/adducin family protein [Promethearchaeota archaeon]
MVLEKMLRKKIVEFGRHIYNHGFVAATDGNLSVRISQNHILTTPSGISKGFLKEKDLIIIDMNGEKVSGELNPSSEFRMHLKVYNIRSDIHAVIHAHPPVCTGLTIAGLSLEQPVIPEVIVQFGEIPTAQYATPTTEEVPRAINDLILKHDAILLDRHGTLTVGDSLESAYFKLEKLEHAAKVILVAHQFGKIKTLTPSQIEKLLVIRQKYFNNSKFD